MYCVGYKAFDFLSSYKAFVIFFKDSASNVFKYIYMNIKKNDPPLKLVARVLVPRPPRVFLEYGKFLNSKMF